MANLTVTAEDESVATLIARTKLPDELPVKTLTYVLVSAVSYTHLTLPTSDLV